SSGSTGRVWLGRCHSYIMRDSPGEIVARLSGEFVLRGPGESVFRGLRFGPQGDQLFMVQESNRVCKWVQLASGRWSDVAEKETVPGVFTCLSTTKGLFLVANNRSTRQIELLDSGSKVAMRSVGHPKEIEGNLSVAISRDSRVLAVGGDSVSNGVVI